MPLYHKLFTVLDGAYGRVLDLAADDPTHLRVLLSTQLGLSRSSSFAAAGKLWSGVAVAFEDVALSIVPGPIRAEFVEYAEHPRLDEAS